jgi:hypothetical protein
MNKWIGRLALVTLAILFNATNSPAATYDVYARANSSSGGSGLDTINLLAGQAFTVSVDPNDLWNAGELPRWSNADGLVGNLYASGSDDSEEADGTLIGKDWGLWNQFGLSAPFGALVGSIGGTYFFIGTSYSGTAPADGWLKLFYWDSFNTDNTQFIKADINAVPIPAAAWLLGAGLIGLVGLRRKARL